MVIPTLTRRWRLLESTSSPASSNTPYALAEADEARESFGDTVVDSWPNMRRTSETSSSIARW
jgi:hypothetical protein